MIQTPRIIRLSGDKRAKCGEEILCCKKGDRFSVRGCEKLGSREKRNAPIRVSGIGAFANLILAARFVRPDGLCRDDRSCRNRLLSSEMKKAPIARNCERNLQRRGARSVRTKPQKKFVKRAGGELKQIAGQSLGEDIPETLEAFLGLKVDDLNARILEFQFV
jgi:hypothetical protein